MMRIAIDEARAGLAKGEQPFGTVITSKETIVCQTHSLKVSTSDPTAHSETLAIRAASHKLQQRALADCVVYTTCEPCPMCLGAIYWARLRRVYFANTRIDAAQIGFDDEFIYREVAQVPELRKIPHVRLMGENAQLAFKEWAASPEKIRY